MWGVFLRKPVVGLALGAGAARGMAHIGVLQVLESEKIPIDLIAGTSIGSVFGALYADNVDLEMLARFVTAIKYENYIDLVVPKMGLIKGEKIEQLFKLLTKNKQFSELAKPLYVIAVDIETGKEVIINSGMIADALRASVSIPGIMQPKKLDNKLLVDGALRNHVPITVLKDNGADYVIAVDVRFGGFNEIKHKVDSIFDIILLSIDIGYVDYMEKMVKNADVLIQPNLSHVLPARFDLAKECIEIGREKAIEILPKITEDLKKIGVL